MGYGAADQKWLTSGGVADTFPTQTEQTDGFKYVEMFRVGDINASIKRPFPMSLESGYSRADKSIDAAISSHFVCAIVLSYIHCQISTN